MKGKYKTYTQWFQLRSQLYEDIVKNQALYGQIYSVLEKILRGLQKGNKILIFGNGGSSNQAQHFAAELVCRFEKERKAIPAIALTTDTSIITAQGNDIGYYSIFSREIEALCNKGDIVIGITTSDVYFSRNHSRNILEGFKMARKKGGVTIGFFCKKTKHLLPFTNEAIIVPSDNPAMIQEVHLSIMHLLCHLIEDKIK